MSNMITGIKGAPVFYGVVENRLDPMELGRVQVRIMGLHSDVKVKEEAVGQGIPTEDLPWAYPMQPITSAAMNGIGSTPLGPVEGTHVVGISRDGRFMNDLIIIGTLGGIPQEIPNPQFGFNDPREAGLVVGGDEVVSTYPKSAHLKEPDTNRLARVGEKDNTIHKAKVDTQDKEIPRANEVEDYEEILSPYAAEYPYNHVTESESGHISEVDDTVGAERLHTYHRSGTFEEIHPDGTKVTKIVGDDFEIIHRDKRLHVKGNISITVDGDADILVMGNVEEQVKKNVNRVIEGNITELVKGTVTRTVEGAVSETFKDTKTLDVTGTDSETIGGAKSSTVSGSETNSVSGSQSNSVSGGITTDGGPTVVITAGRVDIN